MSIALCTKCQPYMVPARMEYRQCPEHNLSKGASMSDMTIESARQYVSTHGPMCAIQPCGHLDDRSAQHCHYCRGFIAGHASRDPEVEKLKAEIEAERKRGDAWAAKADTFDWDRQTLDRDLKAEREKLKSYTKEKFSCPCGETTYLLEQNPNHFVGCISHNPTEVEKLKKENRRLEAQQKVWHGMLFWNGETYRPEATPEGGVVPVVEPVKVTKILDELSAGREASRKLAETAQDVVWCLRKHVTIHDSCTAHLEEALKFYATPGHSPEGKTL